MHTEPPIENSSITSKIPRMAEGQILRMQRMIQQLMLPQRNKCLFKDFAMAKTMGNIARKLAANMLINI